SSRAMSVSSCSESNPKCSSPWWAPASPGPRRSPLRAPEMLTKKPSSLAHRTKRSPKTRTSSLRILKRKAWTYQSAVFRGSGAFRWMWLIRYGMRSPPGSGWVSDRPPHRDAGLSALDAAWQRRQHRAGLADDGLHDLAGAGQVVDQPDALAGVHRVVLAIRAGERRLGHVLGRARLEQARQHRAARGPRLPRGP